jgi:hypothetical protein
MDSTMFVKHGIVIHNQGYSVDAPDPCPICHRHSEITVVQADQVENGKGVQVVFRCAYRGCRVFFIGSYGPMPSSELLTVRPLKPLESTFSETISGLSPTFVSIFAEAAEAKHLGLKQIAGPGYRKAFEFLIRDYAKSLARTKEKEIESKFSGAVVKEFIPDARIQGVATRCLWLGNDETHYLRKWTDLDVGDLVTLINLTTHWIEIEQLSKAYVEEMPG